MSPLGSLGGIQFSSIPSSNTLVIVRHLGGDGAVNNMHAFRINIMFIYVYNAVTRGTV